MRFTYSILLLGVLVVGCADEAARSPNDSAAHRNDAAESDQRAVSPEQLSCFHNANDEFRKAIDDAFQELREVN